MRVIVQFDDAPSVDITEGVQCMYDIIIQSMDWGSGFLSVEEALPVVHIAKTCGFKDWEAAQAYVDAQAHSEEQKAFLQMRAAEIWQRKAEAEAALPRAGMDHEHIWSTRGKCVWPGCHEVWVPQATESKPSG